LRELGVPVVEVGWKAWYDPKGPMAMVQTIRKHGVDLIHSHLPGQNFYSCIAGALTKRKTLVTYHGPVELQDAESAKGKARLWFVRRTADRTIVVCKMVKGMLVDRGFREERISVIYNGIDPAPYASPSPGTLRASLRLAPDAMLIGMIANVRQSKGYDVLVRAAAEVCRRFPSARFVGVGHVDEGLARPIRQQIDNLSLREKFIFAGFRADVPQVLSDLDVFVLSSTSEGMPLAILEAMAARKAIVATRCGGIPEVLEDGHSGLLVPPSDPGGLARAIEALLSDRSRALRMARHAESRLRSEFTLGGMIERYENLYLSELAL
jgi:glycosyltransferase involved in cell wall biosynthesis